MSSYIAETSAAAAENQALNGSFGTAAFAPDGTLLRANNRLLRMLGLELGDIQGHLAPSLVMPCHDAECAQLWQALREGQPQTAELSWRDRNNEKIWLWSDFTPIRENGVLSEIVMLAREITQEKADRADTSGQIDAIHQSQAVVHFALDGTVIEVNDLFLKAMGYEREEVVRHHHRMFVTAEEAESEDYKLFWKRLREGQFQAAEFRRLGKNNREVWLQATYNPILDANGQPFKVVKYASDVTQEKLRQAEYQWQVAAIHKSHCVVTFDMFGTVIDANDLFLEAMGYRHDEVVGRHHRMFLDPFQVYDIEYVQFWRNLNAGRHSNGLFKHLGKNGQAVWLQATYNPIFDMSGRPSKVVAYATVVTETRLQQAEHQGQIAAINKTACVIAFAMDGTILDANDNFLDATGYRFGEVRGRHHRMFVEPDYAQSEEYAAFWADLRDGCHKAGEYKRVTKSGREIWLQATYNPILDMEGQPFKVVKYATDITQEKLLQADFQGQIEAIRKSQGVITLGLDGAILEANDAFLDMLGYEFGEIEGRSHSILVEPGIAASADYREFWETLRSGRFISGMYKRIGKDGREVWIQASYNPILDPSGRPYKIVKFASDVTSNVALAEAFDDAKRQAQHDSATALPNRVRLANYMSTALEHPGARMAVLYLDLDRFKPINDTFGHHVGDRVLGEIADRLRRSLKDDQIAARIGGDEFVIAAPNLSDDQIETLCQQLLDIAQLPIRHEHGEVRVGVSIGVAISPADGVTTDDLLRNADAALYRSKQSGRGSYSFFSDELNARLVSYRTLADDLRRGIAAGEFFLEYQPRFDTRTRSIRSVEALVRWSHPERGRMNPAEFISLAERTGLIVPLGAWILKAACHAARQWDDIGVSVNVSPVQFRSTHLPELVRETLRATGLDASKLELEVTEGVLLDDADHALRVLSELKDVGVKLAIDDFGTGYSSLSYLRSFPFDVIKIDRQFISDIDSSTEGRAIVQAILGLGKALGLSVTAEGVETNGQLALLTLDQCKEVQGFLLARPLPEGEVASLLEATPVAVSEPAEATTDLDLQGFLKRLELRP